MAAANEKSEYFQSFGEEGKKGYLAKLTLSTGERLPDPVILHSNWWDDVSLLPDITYPDIYHYLIRKESLKAYKSLESYTFFVSGHVQNVYHHKVEKKCKFCFIKMEVRNWSLLSFWFVYIQNLMLNILDYLSISNIKFSKNSSVVLTINDLRRIFNYSKHGVNILIN